MATLTSIISNQYFGSNGSDANVIYSGTVPPSNELGDTNNFYLDSTAQLLYGPKTISEWGTPSPIYGQTILYATGAPASITGRIGDYYINSTNYDYYIKTESGWQGPNRHEGWLILSGNTVPDSGLGKIGDFYLKLDTSELYGPKTVSGWGSSLFIRGNTIFNGTGTPSASLGIDGDFYYDMTQPVTLRYGPKTSGDWGTGIIARNNTVLSDQANLNLSLPDNSLGIDGDFYINAENRYGPKAAGVWDSNTKVRSLYTVHYGTTDPDSSIGDLGDYYKNTTYGYLFGPKTELGWEDSFRMIGNRYLSGSSDPISTTGNDGDYYLNTSAMKFYGPKVAGSWNSNPIAFFGEKQELGSITGTASIDMNYRRIHANLTGNVVVTAVNPNNLFITSCYFENTTANTITIDFDSSIIPIKGVEPINVPPYKTATFSIGTEDLVNYFVNINPIDYTAPVIANSWNPSDKAATISVTNLNRTTTSVNNSQLGTIRAFNPKSSGKWRYAIRIDGLSFSTTRTTQSNFTRDAVGICPGSLPLSSEVGATNTSFSLGWGDLVAGGSGAPTYWSITNNVRTTQSFTQAIGRIIGVLVDFDAGKIWFTVDGAVIGGGDPEAGTGNTYTVPAETYYPAVTHYFAYNNSLYPSNCATFTLMDANTDPFANTWPSFQTWS